MSTKEIAIKTIIQTSNLDLLEPILKESFPNGRSSFIESNSVLLFEDFKIECSIEHFNNYLYLTGIISAPLKDGLPVIEDLKNGLFKMNISFSIDYQEQDENGKPTSEEFSFNHKSE